MINDVTLGAVHTHTGNFNQLDKNEASYNFLNKIEVFLGNLNVLNQVFIITKQINIMKEARISA